MDEFAGGPAVFLDTNVLVYVIDHSDEEKCGIAKDILSRAFEGKFPAVVSNQVLSEAYTTLARRNVPEKDAFGFVQALLDPAIGKFDYSTKTVIAAVKISQQAKVHFWDALIAATMLENGVFEIITENCKDFAKIPGIRARSPFAARK